MLARNLQVLMVLSLALAASQVDAQGPAAMPPPSRYEPARPTISPYLNLLRRDAGPIPNYYSLVRPQLNQIEINQRQQVNNRLQQTQIQDNSRNITNVSKSIAGPTGTASVYRSYGHYYPRMSR